MAVMQPERIARAVEYEWPPLLTGQIVLMGSYQWSPIPPYSRAIGAIADLTLE